MGAKETPVPKERAKLRGKRKIADIQSYVDNARLWVGRMNDILLIVQEEGPPALSPEECSTLLEGLIMAEDAIREAKILLEKGV